MFINMLSCKSNYEMSRKYFVNSAEKQQISYCLPERIIKKICKFYKCKILFRRKLKVLKLFKALKVLFVESA